MRKLNYFFKKLDWPLIIFAIVLTSFGLIELYGISFNKGNFLIFKKQIIFFILGISLMFLISGLMDYRFLKRNRFLILFLYLFICLLLLGVLFFGERIRGVRGWYRLGDLSFSPTPFMAIALVLVLAKYFSKYHTEIYRTWHLFFSFIYVFSPSLLIFLQPDLGSIIGLILIWLSVIIFSGVKISHFLILLLIFSLIFTFSWFFLLKDYQKQRIETFLNPRFDPKGISWQVEQSKIAIGEGGILGKGIGKGGQVHFGFLPEAKTDFIFPAIAEETGFLGVSVFFLFFFLFLFRIIKIGLASYDNFSRLFCLGFCMLVLIQTFINIGMSIGIMPVIGIPLPFVSYGGSHLIANYIGLGIILSIKRFPV